MLFTVAFWKDALDRAGKTFAQTLLATLTTGGLLVTVGWKAALVNAGVAALYSVLTSAGVAKGVPAVRAAVRSRRGQHEAAHPPTPES